MSIFEPLVLHRRKWVSERYAHFELVRRLFDELLVERRKLPTGFAFRFNPEAFTDLARFVATERRCFPLVDFEIALTRAPSELWLGMHGPEGTRNRLEAKLGRWRARGAPRTCAAQDAPASVA
jgi:hypothetical protein